MLCVLIIDGHFNNASVILLVLLNTISYRNPQWFFDEKMK